MMNSIDPTIPTQSCISIIGMGSFGTLLYELLTQVAGIDPSQIITYHHRQDDHTRLAQCYQADVILVCTPLAGYVQMLCDIIAHPVYQSHQGLIVDMCSIKHRPMQGVQEYLQAHPEYHARIRHTHPMRGPQSVDVSLALAPQLLRIVVCESCGVSDDLIQQGIEYLRGLGFVMVEMSSADHDRQAAISQFRTYLIARIVRSAGLSSYTDTDIHGQLYDDVMIRTCRIFDDQDYLFEPYAIHNQYCREVILRLYHAARHMSVRDGDYHDPDDMTLVLTHAIESEIICAYVAQLLQATDLLQSTAVDTKNATRINTELEGVVGLNVLSYDPTVVDGVVKKLIDSTITTTQYLMNHIDILRV